MANVTRDKKKYGAPTVYSKKKREEKERQEREEEMHRQRTRDISNKRRDAWNGRVLPILDDE
jgi:hypothetical protein